MSDHIENLSKNYINYFKNKDLNELNKIFDNHIQLIDWEVNLLGKDAVLEHNKNLFNIVDSIQIEIKSVTSSVTTVFAEIDIIVNGTVLNVLDVITFNKVDKIIKIQAYKFDEAPEDVLWQRKLAEYRKRDPFVYN